MGVIELQCRGLEAVMYEGGHGGREERGKKIVRRCFGPRVEARAVMRGRERVSGRGGMGCEGPAAGGLCDEAQGSER